MHFVHHIKNLVRLVQNFWTKPKTRKLKPFSKKRATVVALRAPLNQCMVIHDFRALKIPLEHLKKKKMFSTPLILFYNIHESVS